MLWTTFHWRVSIRDLLSHLLILVILCPFDYLFGDVFFLFRNVITDLEGDILLVVLKSLLSMINISSLPSQCLLELGSDFRVQFTLHYEDVVLEKLELPVNIVKLVDQLIAFLIHLRVDEFV